MNIKEIWITPVLENLDGSVIIQSGNPTRNLAESTTFTLSIVPQDPAAAGAAACGTATTGTVMIYESVCSKVNLMTTTGNWNVPDGNFANTTADNCGGLAAGAGAGAQSPFSCS